MINISKFFWWIELLTDVTGQIYLRAHQFLESIENKKHPPVQVFLIFDKLRYSELFLCELFIYIIVNKIFLTVINMWVILQGHETWTDHCEAQSIFFWVDWPIVLKFHAKAKYLFVLLIVISKISKTTYPSLNCDHGVGHSRFRENWIQRLPKKLRKTI